MTSASAGIRGVVKTVVVHPSLWLPALGALLRLSQPRWWKRWPPVPLPSESLWRLRMLTAYGGDGTASPDAGDVRSYLEWSSTRRLWRRR